MLYQLFPDSHHLASSFRKELERAEKLSRPRITEIEAMNCLLEIVTLQNRQIFLVIDGLDESTDPSSIAAFLPRLAEEGQGGIKIVVLSRDIPEIRKALNACKSLSIQAKDNMGDIHNYLRQSVSSVELESTR